MTTTPLQRLSEVEAGMTPGAWQADDADILAPSLDAWILRHPAPYEDCPLREMQANAIGIVTARRLLAFCASPDAVEEACEPVAVAMYGTWRLLTRGTQDTIREIVQRTFEHLARAAMGDADA